MTGGCLCGEIRYETTSEPMLQSLCYCTDCQTVSGAAGYAVYAVPFDSFVVTRGELAAYEVEADSGRTNARCFCSRCGTRVCAKLQEPGFVSVNGLTLDDRGHFSPASIHYPDSAPDWCRIDRNLKVLPPIPRDS